MAEYVYECDGCRSTSFHLHQDGTVECERCQSKVAGITVKFQLGDSNFVDIIGLRKWLNRRIG